MPSYNNHRNEMDERYVSLILIFKFSKTKFYRVKWNAYYYEKVSVSNKEF